MATFNYTVDTNPMAAEIGNVSNHVKATTNAVVAMKAAVVLAEEKAADHVCKNVTNGFFKLINSQITQKIAQKESERNSHLMLLGQKKIQLNAIQKRMERDYHSLSIRYQQVFNRLNVSLKQQTSELDKPVFNFAEREIEKVSNRTKYLTASVPVSQLESLAISQKIVASNVKFRGLKVIGSMTNFLSGINQQKKLTDRILLPVKPKTENAVLSVPVIISECNFDKFNNRNIDVVVSKIQLDTATQQTIKNTVNQNINNMQWQNETDINREVKSEFSKILSSSGSSQRVKDMTGKLFLANAYQTIKI